MIAKVYFTVYRLIKLLYYKIIYKNKLIIGKNFRMRPKLKLNITGGTIEIGNNVFINSNCSLNAHALIKIGDNCILGEDVKIYDHNYIFQMKSIPIRDQGFTSKETIIGNNCWIGSNVIILKGVTIGNNCIIAAGSIINENIPDNMILKPKSENYILEEIKYKGE